MRYVKDAEYTSPAAYTGDVDISGIWNVPLAQLERDRPPTWYFAIGSMPGTFALEPAHGKGDSGSSHALVFTLQISVRVCCASLEMREVHVLQQRSGDEPNTWHQTLRGGRREVLKFVSEREALLEGWGADGSIEWTRQWSRLGTAAQLRHLGGRS